MRKFAMTKVTVTGSLIVLAALILSACGGNGNGPSGKVPDYSGGWTGNYTVTGCTQSGGVALANLCGSIGNSAPYTFSLQQSSRSVTGTFALGSIGFPSTGGTIDDGGGLTLQGTTLSNGVTIIVTWHLTNNGTLGGTVTQNWTSTTLAGQANVVGTLTNAIRSKAAVVEGVRPATLEGLLKALKE